MSEILARTVLWYYVFCGFVINYMIRTNTNIAIVSMVVPAICRQNRSVSCMTNGTSPGTTPNNLGTFYWDEYDQSLILGAFFWSHWLTQIPGGLLARNYGTKLVFGLSNLGMGIASLLIPYAAYWNLNSVIFLRCFQGFSGGFAWPAMHHLTAHWIPPNERGKFVSAYMGSSIGITITYPMCGIIIDALGWEYAFYIPGTIVIIWFILWSVLVYDKPADHPRISEKEKTYIERCLGESVTKSDLPVPWCAILTSLPVYMNVIAQIGGIWGLYTLMTQAPTYFKFIHGWNNKMTGLFSGIPHLCRCVFACLFGLFADFLLKKKLLSQTNVRNLATFTCVLMQGFLILGLAYSGYNSTAAVIYLTLATAVHGAVSSGPLASVVELSPNFASILLGVAGMLSQLPSFLSPILVGMLTLNNQTPEQWTKVFQVSSALLFVCGILYLFFSNSELQPWNDPTQYKLIKQSKHKSNKKHEHRSINTDSC